MAERKEVKVLVDSLTSEGKSIKANSVEKLLEEDYEKLIGLKNVRDYDEELDGKVEEADESVFEEMIETLEEKVTALEGEKTTLTEKVTALEGENKTEALTLEVERLVGLLETSIDLNKGKVPDGYTRVS